MKAKSLLLATALLAVPAFGEAPTKQAQEKKKKRKRKEIQFSLNKMIHLNP